jgi:exopolyphosphatase/guanosine-5'-triphosphate,3'-diphosphate pyrophosphatase
MRLAAIDIGSNAARLLISDVFHSDTGKPEFQKINLVRVPLRLGFDVFEKKTISPERESMILSTIKAYKLLLDAYGVGLQHLKAAATSAMRDADNGEKILKRVKEETGIDIDIITGDTEATLIYENHVAEKMDKDHLSLYRCRWWQHRALLLCRRQAQIPQELQYRHHPPSQTTGGRSALG